MSKENFIDRFKGKVSVLGKQGPMLLVESASTNPITKTEHDELPLLTDSDMQYGICKTQFITEKMSSKGFMKTFKVQLSPRNVKAGKKKPLKEPVSQIGLKAPLITKLSINRNNSNQTSSISNKLGTYKHPDQTMTHLPPMSSNGYQIFQLRKHHPLQQQEPLSSRNNLKRQLGKAYGVTNRFLRGQAPQLSQNGGQHIFMKRKADIHRSYSPLQSLQSKNPRLSSQLQRKSALGQNNKTVQKSFPNLERYLGERSSIINQSLFNLSGHHKASRGSSRSNLQRKKSENDTLGPPSRQAKFRSNVPELPRIQNNLQLEQGKDLKKFQEPVRNKSSGKSDGIDMNKFDKYLQQKKANQKNEAQMSMLQRKQLQMLLKKQYSLEGVRLQKRRGESQEGKPQTEAVTFRKEARHSEHVDPRQFSEKLMNLKSGNSHFPNTLHLKSLKINSQLLPSSRSGSTGKETFSIPIYSPKPRELHPQDQDITSQDDNLSIVTGSSKISQGVSVVLDHQKKGKYYELGGLGSNVGSEAHRKAQAKLQTINEYSKYIRKSNMKRNKSNTTLTRHKLQEQKEALINNYESVI